MRSARSSRIVKQSSDAADGKLSGQTAPPPGTMAYGANLTPDAVAGIGAWTDEQVIQAIRKGVNAEGNQLCSNMPRYPDMPDSEVQTVVAYLKSLRAVNRAIPKSICGGP